VEFHAWACRLTLDTQGVDDVVDGGRACRRQASTPARASAFDEADDEEQNHRTDDRCHQ